VSEDQDARDLYALRCAGFVRIPGFLPTDTVARLLYLARAFEGEVESFVAAGGLAPRRHQYPLRTTRALFAIAPEFQAIALDPRLLARVRAYLGEVRLRDCQLQTNLPDPANEARGVGGDVSFHRDTLWPDGPIRADFLHAMIALTPCSRENGATIVVPGSHREREPKFYFKHHDPRPTQPGGDYPVYPQRYFPSAVSIECEVGDLVMLDPMTIHSHGINTSRSPRSILCLPFRRTEAKAEPTLLDARSIALGHARAPVPSDLVALLDRDLAGAPFFGPLGDSVSGEGGG
jgi:ectoine hydroxylase-related dioxygenase (phytanoyl-CoA dioxygenase family)